MTLPQAHNIFRRRKFIQGTQGVKRHVEFYTYPMSVKAFPTKPNYSHASGSYPRAAPSLRFRRALKIPSTQTRNPVSLRAPKASDAVLKTTQRVGIRTLNHVAAAPLLTRNVPAVKPRSLAGHHEVVHERTTFPDAVHRCLEKASRFNTS